MRIVRYDDGREFKRDSDISLLINAQQSFTVSEIENMKSCFVDIENELDEANISFTVYNKYRFFNLYSLLYSLFVLILWLFVNIYFVYLFPLGLYVAFISSCAGLLIVVPVIILHTKVFCHAQCELIKKKGERSIEVLFKK